MTTKQTQTGVAKIVSMNVRKHLKFVIVIDKGAITFGLQAPGSQFVDTIT